MANNILIAANQLALKFSEDSDIPTRFKKEKKKREDQKSNLNTLVEKRFQENIEDWKQVVVTMLKKIENQQVWRFITLKPNIEDDISNAVYSKDFSDFTEYLILRRDKENCDFKELGLLAMLHTEFQREIDRQIDEKRRTTR
jgi:hypothetical protein